MAKLAEYDRAWELVLVNRIRERVAECRTAGYPNASATTLDLLEWWRREGRQQPLFFVQIEAVETILFLVEGRADLRQGLSVPADEPTAEQDAQGVRAFMRYACKMATGTGKTTVMGMIAAWSIFNKVTSRGDARFSDFVLIVCPKYHNLWKWIMGCLTPAERGGKKASPRPEAVLKWAHAPMAMIAQDWERVRAEWSATDETRPPVLIVVCRDTRLARATFEWIAEGWSSTDVPPFDVASLQNRDDHINTIRVDSKVMTETDGGSEASGSQGDEVRWMRFTLDTVGKRSWPVDSQRRPLYPPDFETLATKLERPLHPPGRDVRCIVSVGMLTEGWDANTVTHVVGLRPFQSQLLCEQVVGRALRRASYDVTEGDDGPRFGEEVAQVLGVPFEIIPFKSTGSTPPPPSTRRHVRALPERAAFEIRFPRVEGYTQAVRNRIAVDWEAVPELIIDPATIPPEVFMGGVLPDTTGRVKPIAPGQVKELTLAPYLAEKTVQQHVFRVATALTRQYVEHWQASLPAHVLFPQLARVVQRYVDTKVRLIGEPKDVRLAFIAPYYSQMLDHILPNLQPDTSSGEAPDVPRYEARREPGSTSQVSFWTGRDVRDTVKSHVNYLVADTRR